VAHGPRRAHEDARVDVRQRGAAVEPVGLQHRERAQDSRRRRRLMPLAAAAAALAALRLRRLRRWNARS
jgi:hypothetical protein